MVEMECGVKRGPSGHEERVLSRWDKDEMEGESMEWGKGGSGEKGGACGSEVELGEIVVELRGIWETFWQKTE